MQRTRTTTGRIPLLLACIALVLGILGMHALNHRASLVDRPGTATSMAGMTHDSGTTRAVAAAAALVTGAALTSVPGPQHSMGDLVMLCIAVLVGAAAGLLLALGLRRDASGWLIGPRRERLSAAVSPQRRATGPPYVWEFSVIRC